AGVALVDVLLVPQALEQARQAVLAPGVLAGAQLGQHGADALEAALADLGHQRRLVQRHRRDVPALRRVGLHLAGHGLDQPLDELLARAAAGAGPRGGADGVDRALALADGVADGPLADAVAVADLVRVRQV